MDRSPFYNLGGIFKPLALTSAGVVRANFYSNHSLTNFIFFAYFMWCFSFQDAIKMNQLQNLLHDALIATNHVQSCAIVRRKDAVLRASSVGFNVRPLDSHNRYNAYGSLCFSCSCFLNRFRFYSMLLRIRHRREKKASTSTRSSTSAYAQTRTPSTQSRCVVCRISLVVTTLKDLILHNFVFLG